VYSVQDTGKDIKGKRIDVWMPSSREARNFGRQNVRLTVLKYGGKRKPKGK
jgi:3D (Asp-Asp-Asp) domain-containing protein